MCVYSTGIVRNELMCGYANVVHTSSSFHTHIHTHTHILIPFEDSEPTGLNVDIAACFITYSRMCRQTAADLKSHPALRVNIIFVSITQMKNREFQFNVALRPLQRR